MTTPPVVAINPACTLDTVGFIPTFLDLDDLRPAKEQFAERYVYGGWHNQPGFTEGNVPWSLNYPGDPPLMGMAAIPFRDELIIVYSHGYVAIWQPDGSFEACRMD